MDKAFFLDVPNLVLNYIKKLEKEKIYSYKPSMEGVSKYGELLSLGFSCYAMKIYYMTSEWDKLSKEEKEEWVCFINSFQAKNNLFPENSFIDPYLIDSYKNLDTKEELKYLIKSVLNFSPFHSYDGKKTTLLKSVNAETKQAVSTLHEIENSNNYKIENVYSDKNKLNKYLDSLDWSTPWTSGAQFASICVLSRTQGYQLENFLDEYITKMVDINTGSYYSKYPSDNREIINGAMKVISGLDWLEIPIHEPNKLIDFCLENQPILEGCDIVDFVYVLYKCSKQTGYRKKEINDLFGTFLKEIEKLYIEKDGGFSYFHKKAQTHYYGVQITEGLNEADIHGTTLCLWAILMILDSLEIMNEDMNIIKP